MSLKAIIKTSSIRIVLLLIVAFLAGSIISYSGNFPYKEIINGYGFPAFLTSWANFDGAHYLNIAREGYHTYDQAFFPLYPLLIKGFGYLLGGNLLLAGLLISSVSFMIGIYFFFKLIHDAYNKTTAKWSLFLLLFYPTAFFFTAVYTEGLFFMLTAIALYKMQSKKYVWAIVFAVLSSLTRLQGVCIMIPLFFHFYNSKKDFMYNFKHIMAKKFTIVIAPIVGLLIYMFYLYRTTGDPLFFFTSQPAFGANRSTQVILLPQVYFRYIKIFFLSDVNFPYFVAIGEFLFFNLAFFISGLFLWNAYKKKDVFALGIGLLAIAHIILPTLTGTFSSMPRYTLFAWPIFLYFSHFSPKVKYSIITIFLILQIILTSLFIQGYFIS